MTRLSDTINTQAALLEPVLEIDLGDAPSRLSEAERIWLVGTGTSQHAAELTALMWRRADTPVAWRSSATFVAGPPPRPGDLVIVISHTAETVFARRARELAAQSGAALLSITGRDRGWLEAIETVPAERSDTYTVSYLAALLVLARLGVASGLADFTEADVMRLPDLVAAAALRPPVLDHEPERLLVLAGVGPGAVTAREGALKLREAARLPAEGYEAEYLLHGHAVPLDDRDEIILLVPAEDPEGLVEGMGIAARVEGINVTEVREAADLPDVLAQVPMTVALQSLAAHLADVRGQDPDSVILGAWSDPRLWPDPTIDR